MPHAEINGAHIYYERHGQGKALILSHGGWTDTTHWQPNVPALCRHWEVVAYDRRGCGRSSAPSDDHTWELWRDDLYGLIRHLGLQRVYLSGCSYGAMLSLELALACPQVVAALILESGTCEGLSRRGPGLVAFPRRTDDLSKIQVPTLIIQGELDPFFPPPVAETMQRGIAGSELVIVPGAGHVPHLEEPALFNRAVEDFLLRLEGAA
jgi:pimeloyl-ACP methyl ester carboxylesterase